MQPPANEIKTDRLHHSMTASLIENITHKFTYNKFNNFLEKWKQGRLFIKLSKQANPASPIQFVLGLCSLWDSSTEADPRPITTTRGPLRSAGSEQCLRRGEQRSKQSNERKEGPGTPSMKASKKERKETTGEKTQEMEEGRGSRQGRKEEGTDTRIALGP